MNLNRQAALRGRAPSLFEGVLIAAGACGIFALYFANPYQKQPSTLVLALTVVLLGAAPFAYWFFNPRREALPLLPIYGALTALCYGVAGFLIPSRYIGQITATETSYIAALNVTLASLALTYLGYFAAVWVAPARKRIPPPPPDQLARADDLVIFGVLPVAMLLRLALALHALSFLNSAIECLVDIVLAWILFGLFRGRFTPAQRNVAIWIALPYFGLSALFTVLNGTLFAIASFGLAIGLAYAAARGRFPLAGIALAAVAALFLQTGKAQFRDTVWRGEAQLSALDRAQLFFNDATQAAATSHGFWDQLQQGYTRYNQLHLTAAVIAMVPARAPYRNGDTYSAILTKWIPRGIWRDKPIENVGNTWAKPFGWVGQDDYNTSLNLPWITEMWLNFGWNGVFGVSLAIGLCFGLLWMLYLRGAGQSCRSFAIGFAVSAPLMLPQESNLSISAGNVFIAIVTTTAFAFFIDSAPALLKRYSRARGG